MPDNVKNAMDLTNYAVQTRYPGEYDEITKEEYENSVRIAKNCLDWVDDTIKIFKNKENAKTQ
ncbi:MAG: HEPN domain-containing protein [Treponema sp.]|nr:HEPN domain-containing protein [Treponema sp.]